jgi:hypothetical protein
MKPSAYISDGGILFKESPPDSILKLNPLYAMRELTDEEILLVSKTVPIDADTYDLQEFARAILKKASEK